MGVAHQWRTLTKRAYRRSIQKRVPARYKGNLQTQQATGTLCLVEQYLQSAHIQLHNIQSAYLLREPALAQGPRAANINIPQKITINTTVMNPLIFLPLIGTVIGTIIGIRAHKSYKRRKENIKK